MNGRSTLIALSLFCILLLTGGSAFCQAASQPEAARTLHITGKGEQPNYNLRIWASGREGRVEVRNDSGSLVETLTCPLLQGYLRVTDPAIQAVAEQFVKNFKTQDLDFDGYLDLKGPREFGASWARYCVWLFDPESHMFRSSKADSLAEQLELLYNLEANQKHRRIISYSIGPTYPIWDEYRVEGVGKDRPYWSRLIPVQSCLIETPPDGKPATAVVTRYEQGDPVVGRHLLRADDKRGLPEVCGPSFAGFGQ